MLTCMVFGAPEAPLGDDSNEYSRDVEDEAAEIPRPMGYERGNSWGGRPTEVDSSLVFAG